MVGISAVRTRRIVSASLRRVSMEDARPPVQRTGAAVPEPSTMRHPRIDFERCGFGEVLTSPMTCDTHNVGFS